MQLTPSRFLLFAGLILLCGRSYAQSTTVTFDTPAPSGASDSYINGVFQGINFGTSQWRWSTSFGADPTNNIYFGSPSGTSRTLSFSPSPRVLDSVNVYTMTNGTLTLSDGVNTAVVRTITTGSMQLIVTGWSQPSTTVTVNFTAGWALGVDDIAHRAVSATDTTPPTVLITVPGQGATVTGIQSVSVTASDNNSLAGVQFFVDGVAYGAEDLSAPYTFAWDSTTTGNGPHSLTAVARDGAGNQTTSAVVSVTVANQSGGAGFALRFYGNGVNDIDRVMIRVDDPATNVPGPPLDVGASDFTLEFWMNGALGNNARPAIQCDNNAWIYGNIIFDRDRYGQDRSFGISVAGGRLAFGVTGAGTSAMTLCGAANVLDSQWHHVAVQRRRSDGWLWLYVDGTLQGQMNGPDGDISYPDNGVPMNFCGGPCTNSDPFLVIGAEKHDAGAEFGAYSGVLDELHVSRVLRYSGTNFTRPTEPFTADADSVALYHFDEGQGDLIIDSSGAIGGPTNGDRRLGGSPAGPQWVTQTPFQTEGASQIGQWAGPYPWPLVAIHASLMRTGEVLVWDGETYADLAGPSVRLWNPLTNVFTSVPNSRTNIFCSGHSFLPDGRLLVSGGNADLYIGINDTEIFNPATRTWIQGPAMAFERWYPTTVTLSDGRILSVSGSITCADCTAEIPEIYSPATNSWTQLPGAQLELPLYPFLFLLPDGRVLNPGSNEDPLATHVLDIASQTWTLVDGTTLEGGSAVMYLPGRVMKSGTASDLERSTALTVRDTYVLDMAAATPRWRETLPMAFPRGHHTLTILPDGTVLVTGGGRTTDGVNQAEAVLEAELWSPDSESWTTMASSQVPRLYHSTALLLADGRVLSAGGGRVSGMPIDQLNVEIYSPPYLFRGPRPVIASAPATVEPGETAFVATPDGAGISQVTLLAPGSVTHQVNMHQRFQRLSFSTTSGGLNVQFPSNVNLVPPGDYLLFILTADGVPSVGSFVSVGGQAEPQPVPQTSGISPATVTAGSAGFTLTVDGANFVPGSVVRWNGADRPTTFVSANRVTASIVAANINTGGTVPVVVFTALPGGGTSNAQTFTINNPVPAITSLNPTSSNVGANSFTLIVNGSGFVPGSVIRWNGADRPTTFTSATQLRANIAAADVAAIGTAQVTVFSGTPQGGLSNAQVFSIQYPQPSVSTLAPSSVVAGGSGFTLTVNGAGFVASSVVRWNGSDRPTSFISAGQLSATISTADVTTAGTATVTVFTAAPGGGTSNAATFTIAAVAGNPLPVLSGLSPSSAVPGTAGLTLTVNGSNFINGSTVRWNNSDRVTAFVSASQLTAQVTAADLTAAGTAQVTVFTAGPGGGTSSALTFTITAAPVGLVAAYNFNQGSGTQLQDVSGTGNNGIITGAQWTTSGRNAGALTFNGSSNLVTVADSNALDLTTGMTLEAWVFPTVAPTGWRTIVAKEMTGTVAFYLHACTTNNNRPATGARFGTADQVLYGGSRLTANIWVHLAATYDGLNERLFVNGVQVSSRTQTGPMQTSTGALRIGGNGVFGEYFQGRIDDVRIYNRALSAAQITADMNTPVGP